MFGFGKKNNIEEESEEIVQSEQIHFHAELIEKLIADQSQIYADFKSLISSIKLDAHADIETMLVAFKRGFHSYLMEKNVKLYSYLKHSVELHPQEALTVNNSRVINTQLSRTVNRFIETYLDKGKLNLEKEHYPEFEKELRAIGTEMVDAMRDERQNLFPIYEQKIS